MHVLAHQCPYLGVTTPGWTRDFLGTVEVGSLEMAGWLLQGGAREGLAR